MRRGHLFADQLSLYARFSNDGNKRDAEILTGREVASATYFSRSSALVKVQAIFENFETVGITINSREKGKYTMI